MPPARDSLAASGPSAQIPAGATIAGRFRVEALLQQDGISQTYRATDLTRPAGAAVRIIPMRVLGTAAAQLETDIEKASALVHKNLIEVLTVGREADFLFIATELLDGQTLREFIDGRRREGKTVSFRGACNLIAHIANGVERAAAFMPHGGLNPASVWVNKAGRVKVADLGLARTLPMLARRGAPAGASDNAYVAPELLAGHPPTLASDVFALGVMLYEVMAGRLPSTPLRPISQAAGDAPPALDGVVSRALARDPSARFASPMALRDALTALSAEPAADSGLVPLGPQPATAANGSSRLAGAPQAAPQVMRGVPSAAAPVGAPAKGAAAPLRRGAPVPGQPPTAAGGGGLGAGAAPNGGGRGGGGSSLGSAAGASGGSSVGSSSFSLADVAAGAIDDGQERWLIQKDRLDFGPFSMAQIRAQIDRGEIIGEHVIVDSDTGARKKIKEFPALAELARVSERRNEQLRRANAEILHEKAERKKSMFTWVVVLSALAVVGGGIGYFVLSRKASNQTALASREEAAEIDAFLKGVKPSFTGAHVTNRAAGGGHRAAATKGAFSNDMNFGDASKYASAGDELLDDAVIDETMRHHYRALVPCLIAERKHSPGLSEMSLEFVIRGTGRVSDLKVNNQSAGGFPRCLLERMPTFPKFAGNKTIASWSMSMR